MKIIKLSSKGYLTNKEKIYFGGEYSFLEKFKAGGLGSTKVIYKNGVIEFDEISQNTGNEIIYTNFELLRGGLILWFNQNQNIKCIGLKFNEIDTIRLTTFRIKINFRGKSIIKYKGILEISLKDRHKLNFEVSPSNFKSILKYFLRSHLKNKFEYTVSLKPAERDNSFSIFEIIRVQF